MQPDRAQNLGLGPIAAALMPTPPLVSVRIHGAEYRVEPAVADHIEQLRTGRNVLNAALSQLATESAEAVLLLREIKTLHITLPRWQRHYAIALARQVTKFIADHSTHRRVRKGEG